MEKTLVTSKRYNATKLLIGFLIAGLIVFIGLSCWQIGRDCQYMMDRRNADFLEGLQYAIELNFKHTLIDGFIWGVDMCFLLGCIPVIIGIIIYAWLHSYEMVITDKRVYGRVAFGKRVDLPIDSISATSANDSWKGVAVGTSAGRISFIFLKNYIELHKTLNDLLIERQPAHNTATVPSKSDNTIDDLKKYKELLDSGIITQEEFDAKKKQLLNQ